MRNSKICAEGSICSDEFKKRCMNACIHTKIAHLLQIFKTTAVTDFSSCSEGMSYAVEMLSDRFPRGNLYLLLNK